MPLQELDPCSEDVGSSDLLFFSGREGSYFSMRDDYAEDLVISLLICSETPKAKGLTMQNPGRRTGLCDPSWPLSGQGWCLGGSGANVLAKGHQPGKGWIRPLSHVSCLPFWTSCTLSLTSLQTGQSYSKSKCTRFYMKSPWWNIQIYSDRWPDNKDRGLSITGCMLWSPASRLNQWCNTWATFWVGSQFGKLWLKGRWQCIYW